MSSKYFIYALYTGLFFEILFFKLPTSDGILIFFLLFKDFSSTKILSRGVLSSNNLYIILSNGS